jgi:hypothetical protein
MLRKLSYIFVSSTFPIKILHSKQTLTLYKPPSPPPVFLLHLLILIFRVVFNSPSIQKNLGFDSSFYTMKLNNMQKISIKRLSFSILDLASRDKKNSKSLEMP